MGHDLAGIMDALKDELYGTATTTLGPQQQQMPSRPPRPLEDQAWALLLELGELHGRQKLQEPPRLPPEDQQELLRIIRELQEELRKLSRQLAAGSWPGLQPTQELHLWELQGFPILLFKKLWELLAHQETYLPGDLPTRGPAYQKPAI